MVETGIADSLILVNVPLKSMGCCSRKNWIRIWGLAVAEVLSSVYSLSGALTLCL